MEIIIKETVSRIFFWTQRITWLQYNSTNGRASFCDLRWPAFLMFCHFCINLPAIWLRDRRSQSLTVERVIWRWHCHTGHRAIDWWLWRRGRQPSWPFDQRTWHRMVGKRLAVSLALFLFTWRRWIYSTPAPNIYYTMIYGHRVRYYAARHKRPH